MAQEHLLSILEVIDILNVPRRTLDQWVENGILAPVSIAGTLRFRPEDIRALFEGKMNGVWKGRILVIDDDPLIGESLKKLLEKLGYEVQIASLGLEALDLVSREVFDLVVTDIRMPGMEGLATLRAIRELRKEFKKPQLPEIVITAYEDEKVREEAKRMGVRDFILKPFEVEAFVEALEKILRETKERRRVFNQHAAQSQEVS